VLQGKRTELTAVDSKGTILGTYKQDFGREVAIGGACGAKESR
jgi:hypothetical protein